MTVDELLEVEDGEVVSVSETEELTEGSIGLDGLLVHEVATAGIGNEGLGDSRTTDFSTLGEAEERTEFITDLDRLGEDAILSLTVGRSFSLATTLLVGLLDDTTGLLFNGLEAVRDGNETRLEGGDLFLEFRNSLEERRVDVFFHSGNNRRSDNWSSNDGGGGGGDFLLGGLGLGFLDRGGNRGSDFSLGGLLGGSLGSTHFGVIGGSI